MSATKLGRFMGLVFVAAAAFGVVALGVTAGDSAASNPSTLSTNGSVEWS